MYFYTLGLLTDHKQATWGVLQHSRCRGTRCTLPAITPLSVKLKSRKPATASKPMRKPATTPCAMQAESQGKLCGLSLNPQI